MQASTQRNFFFLFFDTTTLYFKFAYKGKISKIVENYRKKQQNYSLHNSFKKKGKKTNQQTGNLNRTVKVLNLLIYRAPPTDHFHRIVHSFKEGRFLIETLARVRNSGSLLQSNICNLFLLGIQLLSVFSRCPLQRDIRKARVDFLCLDNIKFVLLSFLQFNTETIFPKTKPTIVIYESL